MSLIDLNQFYHRAKKKDDIVNAKVRYSLADFKSPKIGVNVTLLMGFEHKGDESTCPKRYAYGASYIFENLTDKGYERIVKAAKNRFGNGLKAEEYAVKELLKRDDLVAIYSDGDILTHPLMVHKFGKIKSSIWDSNSVGNIEFSAIHKRVRELTSSVANEEDLFRDMHESRWVNTLNNEGINLA